MVDTIKSKNDMHVRLTDERWEHIVTEYSELSGLRDLVLQTVNDPEVMLSRNMGEPIALGESEEGIRLTVVCLEAKLDGFVNTSFASGRLG